MIARLGFDTSTDHPAGVSAVAVAEPARIANRKAANPNLAFVIPQTFESNIARPGARRCLVIASELGRRQRRCCGGRAQACLRVLANCPVFTERDSTSLIRPVQPG